MMRNILPEPTNHTAQRATTGVPGLDSILEGGLPRNRVYLVQGRPGTGKTTFGLQFVLEGARLGEVSLYVALTETEDEVRESARSHGWNLEGVSLTHIGSAASPEAQQTMLHSSDVALPKVTEALLSAIDELRPKRLVIDSLTEIRILARDEFWYREQLMLIKEQLIAVTNHGVKLVVIDNLGGYLAALWGGDEFLSLHLHELLTHLAHQGVTSFVIVTQHGLFGTRGSPAIDVSYLADNVLLFRYFEFEGTVRQALSVFKRRSGKHERTIRELRLGSEGAELGAPLTQFRGVLAGVPRFLGETLDGGREE